MTNVSSVRMVYVQPQERKGRNTALAQAGNAAITTAGVVGAKKLYGAATHISQKMLQDAMPKEGKYLTKAFPDSLLTKLGKKIVAGCESLGEKLFKNGKIAYDLEEIAKKEYGFISSDAATKALKSYKGRTVMGIAAGVTALAFLVHGLFKAGEIKGEAK
jgi:hypothetical protein